MERVTTPTPQLVTVSYLESQRRVNNTDVTRITICCHVDYYMIENSHNVFKVMCMNMSIFLFSGLSCFVNFSVVLSMIGCKSNLRAFWCNLREAK